jgi:glycerol kinase
MSEIYIMAVDQGTSATKTVVFDTCGRIVAKATEPLKSYFPRPGFVEQDPVEIYQNVLTSVKMCLDRFREAVSHDLTKIKACGISNQRETFVLWDRSGRPFSHAVVWQCKRSVDVCSRLKETGLEKEVNNRTGLIIDPYFSGTKMIWLYENNPRVKNAIDSGEVYFGTIDTWLLFKLTGGKSYCTDYTNASRTLFFNINDLQWDTYLLDKFNLRNLNLPQPHPSSYSYGQSDFEGLFPDKINLSALIGDSHAAAFGEGCFSAGTAKATMGTGSSILLNTGSRRIQSENGMVTTICWSLPHRVDYALEGIIVTCGATMNWLRDQLGLFTDNRQTQKIALSIEDTNGVYLVPAFSGLGAPHWKMDAKAAILGLSLGCDRNHVIRAALESIPYQMKDVISAMEQDSGITLKELKVDGGVTSNRFVMQFLANLLKTNVINIGIEEVSALGAACLAGLQQGFFSDISEIKNLATDRKMFSPNTETEKVQASYKDWQKAVKQFL